MKLLTLNNISYTTAISLAAFSGGVATFGMMKLVPGAEIVVGAMGLLFEAGKLTSFAMLHRRSVPRLLRGALATVGLTLMTANIAGVSGFLSHEYEKTGINAQATSHTAEVEGVAISATGEFAAVQFIAGATGASADTVAHAAILTISAVPDVLAVLLLLAAGYAPSHGGAREGAGRPRNQVDLKSKPKAKAKRPIRKPAKLKVINAN